MQAKLAKLRRELIEPSSGSGGGGKGEGKDSPSEEYWIIPLLHSPQSSQNIKISMYEPIVGHAGFDVNKVGDARVGLVGSFPFRSILCNADKYNSRKDS